jgi:hypothetical protein
MVLTILDKHSDVTDFLDKHIDNLAKMCLSRC